MSEVVRCDWCGKIEHRGALVGWFELDRFGIDIRTVADEEGPWHFCEIRCVAEWSAVKAARAEAQR